MLRFVSRSAARITLGAKRSQTPCAAARTAYAKPVGPEMSQIYISSLKGYSTTATAPANSAADLQKALFDLKQAQAPAGDASLQQRAVSLIFNCTEDTLDVAEDAYRYMTLKNGKDQVLMDAMVQFYASIGKKEKSEKLLFEMRSQSLKPTINAYKRTMSAAAAFKDDAAIENLYKALKEDYDPNNNNDEVHVIAINAFGRMKAFARCEDIIEELRESERAVTNALYTALLEAYCRFNMVEKGIVLFKQMKLDNLKPNHIMFNNLIAAGARLKNTSIVERLFRDMRAYGLRPDMVTYNSLIDAYCRAENLRDARKTMLDMERAGMKPDVRSYGPLIVALVKQKHMDQAEGLLREMQLVGTEPDELIWNWLVEGYARNEKIEKAFELAKQMKNKNIEISKKLKHVLLTQSRKQNKTEEFDEIFGAPVAKKQPWQMSYEEEFDALVPRQNALGKAKKWPMYDQPLSAEAPLIDGKPAGAAMPSQQPVIPELEAGEKFKPSDWILVDDPFSTPRSATVQKRKAKEISDSKIKLVHQAYDEQVPASLTKSEKSKAKRLDKQAYHKQRRKEHAAQEEAERFRNKKRKAQSRSTGPKKDRDSDDDYGAPVKPRAMKPMKQPNRGSPKFR